MTAGGAWSRLSPGLVVHQAEGWDTKWANNQTLEENALTESFPLFLHFVTCQGEEAEAENHEGLKGAMNQLCWLGYICTGLCQCKILQRESCCLWAGADEEKLNQKSWAGAPRSPKSLLVLPGALWGRSPPQDFPSLSMRRQLGASSPLQPPVSLPGSGI